MRHLGLREVRDLGTGLGPGATALTAKARDTPHTLRHTAAMALLTADVDTFTIALRPGSDLTAAPRLPRPPRSGCPRSGRPAGGVRSSGGWETE